MADESDLIAQLEARLEETRQHMARHLGAPIVVTIESMGARIVPAWVVESLVKILRQPADPDRLAAARQAAQVQSAGEEKT